MFHVNRIKAIFSKLNSKQFNKIKKKIDKSENAQSWQFTITFGKTYT